jgi:DNA polymerase type B, organellar and viral
LARLGEDYQVVVNKGIFPYLFVNKNNLNYKGLTQDIKYYPPNKYKTLYESTYKKRMKFERRNFSVQIFGTNYL